MEGPIVLFDGICNLCNSAVQFIIRHDRKNRFRFASLQSEAGRQLLARHHLPSDQLDSFILVENNKAYDRSTGALRVAKKLNGLIPLLYGFMIVPKFIRNGVYNWVAKNRYKWFGKKDACMIPTAELKARFLSGSVRQSHYTSTYFDTFNINKWQVKKHWYSEHPLTRRGIAILL